jgi:hypothetical protein
VVELIDAMFGLNNKKDQENFFEIMKVIHLK